MSLLRADEPPPVTTAHGSTAATQEAVDLVRNAQAQVRALALNPVVHCGPPEHDACSFGSLCRAVEVNRNSSYIFESSSGRVPNRLLMELDSVAQSCLALAGVGGQMGFMGGLSAAEVMDNLARREIELLDAIEAAGQEQQVNAVRRELAEMRIESDSPLGPGASLSPEAVRENLEEASRRANVSLDNEVFEAWVNFIFPPEHRLSGPSPASQVGPDPLESLFPDDPFLNPGLLNSPNEEDRARYTEQVENRQAEMQRMFDSSREQVIEYLREKSTPSNRAQMEALIQRVETLRLNPPLSCPIPNAYYNSSIHAVSFCRSMMGFPLASLRSIMLHEIGHAIDPCLSSMNLVALPEAQGGGYAQVPLVDPETSQQLISAGLPSNRFPFSGVLQCLAGEDSVGARNPGLDLDRRALEDRLRNLRTSGYAEDSAEIQRVLEALEVLPDIANPACRQGENSSQLQEGFADWIATEVLARELPEADLRRQLFESNVDALMFSCGTVQPEIRDAVMEQLQEAKCNAAQDGGPFQGLEEARNEAMDTHSHSSLRTTHILFAHPRFREAMDCPAHSEGGARYCE